MARTRQSSGAARARALASSPSQPPLACLPPELIERILHHIDAARDLAAANATSRLFRGAPGGRSPVEEALRARARARGLERAVPSALPPAACTWTAALMAVLSRTHELARAHSAVVACGDDGFSAFVDAEGGLHTCGEQEVRDARWRRTGEYRPNVALGHPGATPVLLPTRVASLSAVRVIAVAAGCRHLLALSDAGTVYGCGGNEYGQLGRGETGTRRSFQQVRGLEAHIVACIAAGADHSLALTAAGCAYSWGSNDRGQLGHGDTKKRREPTRIAALNGVRIGGLTAGCTHTLLLSAGGDVYSCGDGCAGRLGHGNLQHQRTPRRIEALAGVRAVLVSGGGYHSLVVDAEGSVWSFGWGMRGCLGHGDEATECVPRRVEALAGVRVLCARAGNFCSSVLGADGSVHAFGDNSNGQLGLGVTVSSSAQPTRVAALVQARVTDCALGVAHALHVTADGSVYSCGVQAAALGLGLTRATGARAVHARTRIAHLPRVQPYGIGRGAVQADSHETDGPAAAYY